MYGICRFTWCELNGIKRNHRMNWCLVFVDTFGPVNPSTINTFKMSLLKMSSKKVHGYMDKMEVLLELTWYQ